MDEKKHETPRAERIDLKLRRRATACAAVKTGVRAGHPQVTPL